MKAKTKLTPMQSFFLDRINETEDELDASYLAGLYYASIGMRRYVASRAAFGQTSAGYRTCRKLSKDGLIKETLYKTVGGYSYSLYAKITND